MLKLLEKNGFKRTKDFKGETNNHSWFIKFNGETYYVESEDGNKWWVSTYEDGVYRNINRVAFTTFEHIENLFNAMTLGEFIFN
jgi:uncharacterized membrane-anchored protein